MRCIRTEDGATQQSFGNSWRRRTYCFTSYCATARLSAPRIRCLWALSQLTGLGAQSTSTIAVTCKKSRGAGRETMRQSIKLLSLLGASFALGPGSHVTSLPASDCLYECEGPECYNFSNNTALCREIRAKCQTTCSNKRSYGAIAYSARDKGAGWSFGWDDQAKAEKVALDNCSGRGAACKTIVWYYNSCGAVAADGNIVTWGRDNTRRRAEQTALAECTKGRGKKCAIEASQCSLN
jgi:hypothetical protein